MLFYSKIRLKKTYQCKTKLQWPIHNDLNTWLIRLCFNYTCKFQGLNKQNLTVSFSHLALLALISPLVRDETDENLDSETGVPSTQ